VAKGELILLCQKKNQFERAHEDERERQVAFHSGGRVCCAKKWNTFGKANTVPLARASDRHWSVQGAAGRSKVAAPKRGKQRTKRQAKRDLTKGRAGRRKKPSRKRSAQRNARLNARAVAQHQGRHCRDTRSAWRGNALYDRVRLRQESSAHAEARR